LNIILRLDPPVAVFLQKLTNSVAFTKTNIKTNIIRTVSGMRDNSNGNSDDLVEQLRQKARELLSIADRLEKQAAKERGKTAASSTENKLSLGASEENSSPELSGSQPSLETIPMGLAEAIASLTPHILLSRSEYQTCHIRVPGSKKRCPAIFVDGDYFSLVKVFSDLESTLAAKAKLDWNGDRTIITQLPTGYALWVWEPEATSDLSPREEKREKRKEEREKGEENFPLSSSWGSSRSPLRVVKTLDSQNLTETDLAEYLLVFNRLSEWARCYLGTAVIAHYWKCTRPDLAWFDRFEIVESGHILCRNCTGSSLSLWQEKQLELWLSRFIQRCRRVIPNFPQSFESEYKSTQLLACILDSE
jgi:hypothetical protein